MATKRSATILTFFSPQHQTSDVRGTSSVTPAIMERRLGQNSSFLFDSKPQSMENNHCNNDVDHLAKAFDSFSLVNAICRSNHTTFVHLHEGHDSLVRKFQQELVGMYTYP